MLSAQLTSIRKPAAIAVSSLAALAVVATPAGAATAAEPGGEPIGIVAPYDPPADEGSTQAGGSRWIDIYTTDGGTRGARYYGTLTWRGKAPYSGRISGEVEDRDADGYCGVVEVALDGTRFTLTDQQACEGKTHGIGFNYKNTYIAKVRVCRLKGHWLYNCSAWS
ncbi:hypothetical protein SAMN05421504_111247 [Amycolatopsis xylanica]|uniref:Secreted protein n=1 Tax=Amycolatopsis xylanica TaxID=589385 RepID=A0A1H3RPH6_9PSEU|nr:hypothetical protein [Amycolatopsis xylanica]SDZ27606.1 hypothetical protein SAMN05421504_111247 [Amycolatopsis xylanica]